ncbi:hypothetical protein QBC38DRAFT_484487 [Podospora fimiseda]|uniref:Uncharacterized protein n=1 Tax=Podospora fimiseda TaxID=252190 RepID=A0AAN7GQY1_9PEZI|nr:hypothetical protein QBC38DRAFT_484487 [Podospora fimiseda]
MTSSVLDGVGDMQSPAPPAFSPLTDPAPDSGNREPSVHNDAMLDQPQPEPAYSAWPEDVDIHPDLLEDDPDLNMDGIQMAGPFYPTPTLNTIMPTQTPADTSLIMYLASLAAASIQQPSTVTPSQVSRTAAIDLNPLLAASTVPPVQAHSDAPLESFAKLEFADCRFEMTTYAVIIGRDQGAMKQALRDEKRLKEYQQRVEEHRQMGLPPPSPPTQENAKFSKSYVSAEGGMLGPASDGASDRPAKRRKLRSPASSPGPGQEQQGSGTAMADQFEAAEKNKLLNRQYIAAHAPATSLDVSALRGDPEYTPFIGIHSPGPNIASNTKGISRQHMRIQYDKDEGVFRAIPLHKNGFFVNEDHCKGQPVVLKSGDRIQIKDVIFIFSIPGAKRKEKPEEENVPKNRRYSEGGKEMSFEFEDSRDVDRSSVSIDEDDEEELEAEEVDKKLNKAASKEPSKEIAHEAMYDSDSDLSELEDDMVEPMDEDVVETIEQDSENQPQPFIKPEDMTPEMLAQVNSIPKRRGPGRPPKNGIMSKREERILRKQQQALAKQNQPPPPPGEPAPKRKVGRPRKHPLPEDAEDRPEKRKYKPRTKKNGEEGGEASDPEKGPEKRKREKPKTPPLTLNREDYTEEQLQKPNKNYGVLIDEVLSAAPEGLTLKQIYKRIQQKYPYYYFQVDTRGWESSVRHNLIGNVAFQKDIVNHIWKRVPGVDIDQGKKRKAASPDHSTSIHTFGQQHYQTPGVPPGQMFHAEAGVQHGYGPGGVPQQNPGFSAMQGQVNLGQHPHQHLSGHPVTSGAQQQQQQQQQQPQRPTYPTTASPPQGQTQTQTLGYGQQPAASRQLPPNPQTPGYHSPYGSRPPPPASAPQHAAVPQNPSRPGPPPHTGPSPYNGLPRVSSTMSLSGTPTAARPGPQPAPVNHVPPELKPVVSPELALYINNFKQTTTETLLNKTLQGKMSEVQMIVMSVIARGLGLTAKSIIPEREPLEKIVLGVFINSCNNKFKATGTLHPNLVKDLVSAMTKLTAMLGPKIKSTLNAERLVLSAITRVLGLSDKSWIPNSELYETSEGLLMDNIKTIVIAHQKAVAGLSSQPIARQAWTAAAVPGQNIPQTAARTGSGTPVQTRPMAPIAPHPQSQPTVQQAAPVRTVAPAAPTVYSPTPHALAHSLAAKSQAATAQGTQPVQIQGQVQTQRAQIQQAPPVQPKPTQAAVPQVTQALPAQVPSQVVSSPQVAQALPASMRPVQTATVQTATVQSAVQSVAQTAARQGSVQSMPANTTAQTIPHPQPGVQSVSTSARTPPVQAAAPTQMAPAPAAPTQPVAQPAAQTPALPTTQPTAQASSPAPVQATSQSVSQPSHQSIPPARPSPAPVQAAAQAMSQPNDQPPVHPRPWPVPPTQSRAQPSSGSATPVQAQVQSPVAAPSRLTGFAGLPPKPLVPAPGLAPISPSVNQNPTPATATGPPSVPTGAGPAIYTNSSAITQASQPVSRPPSAHNQVQNLNQAVSSVPSISTQTPPQNAARPANTAVQGQQNRSILQNTTASTPGTAAIMPNQVAPTTAPVTSIMAGSPSNSGRNPATGAPAPVPTATATAAR